MSSELREVMREWASGSAEVPVDEARVVTEALCEMWREDLIHEASGWWSALTFYAVVAFWFVAIRFHFEIPSPLMIVMDDFWSLAAASVIAFGAVFYLFSIPFRARAVKRISAMSTSEVLAAQRVDRRTTSKGSFLWIFILLPVGTFCMKFVMS